MSMLINSIYSVQHGLSCRRQTVDFSTCRTKEFCKHKGMDSISDLVSLARSVDKSVSVGCSKKRKASESAISRDDVERSNYPYPVVPDDHCETPVESYRDIQTFLEAIAHSLNKSLSDLAIFDPYFCEGRVKERLRELGCLNVHNEMKDFYKLIESNMLPQYDVLVTNPPYSGDHMERLLQFCTSAQCRKPWFLLMPNYVYTKDYYSAIFAKGSGSGSSSGARSPFYVTPAGTRRYLYTTPKGRRQEKSAKYTSPFPTFWYCQVYQDREAVLSRAASLRAARLSAAGADQSAGVPTQTQGKLQPAAPGIVVALSAAMIPLEHAPDNDPRKKKLRNNQKRSKNKKRRREAAASAGVVGAAASAGTGGVKGNGGSSRS